MSKQGLEIMQSTRWTL